MTPAAANKSLKRRSQLPVRKDDIRIMPNRKAGPAIKTAFLPARSCGSGDASDLCYQRLQAWLHMVDNYQEFFKSMAAAELDLATVYARIGDILQVPLHEGALLLPPSSEGIQAVARRLKGYQQRMVEGHCAISQEVRADALGSLAEVREEIREMMNSYTVAVRSVYCELAECKTNIKKRSRLLDIAIEAADSAASLRKEVVKDPFIINLEIEALLRKRSEMETRLRSLVKAQQAHIRDFEPQLIERIASVVNRYMGLVTETQKQLRHLSKKDIRAIERIDGGAEWVHFSKKYPDALDTAQTSNGQPPPADECEYAGKSSEWIRVLRQGVVALKEHGPLFRSTWQSKYGVLTSRGYFHVFRSQGDVPKGAPETSVFLPRARIAMVGAGTLQVSTGNKFSRCRITIQDGASSLDNWRLLMESVCHRCPMGRTVDADCGLASPPDSGSSSDEFPAMCLGRSRGQSSRADPAQGHRRRSVALAHNQKIQPAAPRATPLRKARPFSADMSMLTSNSKQPSSKNQMLETPTPNMYLHPLEGTPGASTSAPVGSLALVPFTHLSPIMNVSELSFEGYSPAFSDLRYPRSSPNAVSPRSPNMVGSSRDSSDEAFEQSNAPTGTVNSVDSSSSGAPHQPASLFERNLSQDTESAPIASLPKLQPRKPASSIHEPCHSVGSDIDSGRCSADNLWSARQLRFEPAFGDRGGTRSETDYQGGIAAGGRMFRPRSSIVDLQHQYSSSTGYMPMGFDYPTAEIWHSDVLSIPDPAMRVGGDSRPRPRSMIYQPSHYGDSVVLDPTNPYLGDIIAKSSGTRAARVASRASTSSTGQQTTLWRSSTNSNASALPPPQLAGPHGHQRMPSHPGMVGSASPPLLSSRMSVGPCHSTPSHSRDFIPECANECSMPASGS
ncbi:hypothetical protein GQ54DRAFT_294983 [Martensiomyces pterosporus]|nr:hypothetical protein GQ54DRAFT_294983 [Martensiomyces pterosporus]